MASTNLYPFIVDSYMPAFIREEESCKIYFSLPAFNAISEFNTDLIQIKLVNPNTNKTLFNSQKYPTGIKMAKIQEDNEKGYFVEIPNSDFYTYTLTTDKEVKENKKYYTYTKKDDEYVEAEEPELETNIYYERVYSINYGQYYKVQLRGTSSSVKLNGDDVTETWLNNNANYFSEWSTACLIRAIAEPKLTITKLEATSDQVAAVSALTSIDALLSFTTTEDETEDEFLNTYQVLIYDSNNILIEESDILYTNFSSPNHFYYDIKYNLKNGFTYTIVINYTTINGYSGIYKKTVEIEKSDLNYLQGLLTVTPDNDLGLMQIVASLTRGSTPSSGTLYIRRTSFASNFNTWEIIHKLKIKFLQRFSNYTWYDMTAESGILYKYSLQYIDDKDTTDNAPILSSIVMINLDDMYLLNNKAQLVIKFNPTITSYKCVVTESITTTLGSQYPYVRRNGNNKYRQFQIGGLISSLADPDKDITDVENLSDSIKTKKSTTQESLFLSKSEAFKTALSLYEQYNLDNNISEYRDYIFEKLFRDKVIDFLTDNSVKLFRSATEGNILVKLTNISFTPNQQLGRLVYSFTATATEIDACTIDNYYKYDIIAEPSNEVLTSRYILETIQGQNRENGYNEDTSTAYISYQQLYDYTESNDKYTLILNEEQYQE
jgi:hypothetical protein